MLARAHHSLACWTAKGDRMKTPHRPRIHPMTIAAIFIGSAWAARPAGAVPSDGPPDAWRRTGRDPHSADRPAGMGCRSGEENGARGETGHLSRDHWNWRSVF